MGINKNKQSVAFAFAAVGGCSLNCLVPSQAVEQAGISLSDPSPWTRTHLPKRSSNPASLNPKSKLPLHYKPVAQNSRHLVQILGKKKINAWWSLVHKQALATGPSHTCWWDAALLLPRRQRDSWNLLSPSTHNMWMFILLCSSPHLHIPHQWIILTAAAKKKNAHEMG